MGSFSEGLRLLLDGHYRFVRSGLQSYLRIQNFNNTGAFQEVGVPYEAPTDTGYTDIVIDPPPQVTDISIHNIGMSGGKLWFGARSFKVSQSFVLNVRQRFPSITEDLAVWTSWDGQDKVIGIVYESRMHTVVTYKHTEIAGETISWTLTCNRVDTPLDEGSQIISLGGV